ncbi:MAG: hypothetical protein K2X93_26210 [Candidatus Obscuribacterales bacterium]|nr:hypothetical protein [Candidatus Obscuribacterales bacterium]
MTHQDDSILAEVPRTEINSIYEMNYGERHEITALLRGQALLGKRCIHLPDHESVTLGAQRLGVSPGELLLVYQLLKANDQSDIICNIMDASGFPCGGIMKKYVDKASSQYRCPKDKSHVADPKTVG